MKVKELQTILAKMEPNAEFNNCRAFFDIAKESDISTAASVFSVGELVKVVFEDEEDQIGIYRVVKITDTQCVCEFIK